MDKMTKIQLIQAGRLDLLEITEINEAGYAGVLPNGNIVDRRLNPEAIPVPANSLLGIPEPKELVLRPYDIWMEGFVVTGESGIAHKINEAPIPAYSFDHAVQSYINATPKHGIEKNTPARYTTPEAYLNRDSNWNIWACSLFDNEADARKSFG